MPNPDALCRALSGIDPSVRTLDEFQLATGIQSKSVARSVLEFFEGAGIGTLSGSAALFSTADRMKAAMLCLNRGCDIYHVSGQISWKDFERLTSEALKSFGYLTKTNVRFTRPRMEIDVIGLTSSLALVIDCKHWKHTNRSSISIHSKKQEARARRFVSADQRVRQAVPVILTLQAESIKYVEKIPIVPIAQLHSFLQETQSYMPEMCVISRS
jgi:hypothetical protein